MQKSLLNKILSEPTAPYREQHVIRLLSDVLHKRGIPFFRDSVGNLVLGATSETDYLQLLQKKHEEPLRIFIAHMDHPGFHGVQWSESHRGRAIELVVKWYGGSPTRFLRGARVWLADKSQTWQGQGVMRQMRVRSSKKGIDTGIIKLDRENLPEWRIDARDIFGGFSFRKPVWHTRNYVYSRAADDLIGVFCVVTIALDFFSSHPGGITPFVGLLTRADEVGFIGAIGHFELGWYRNAKRPLVCISIEMSRTQKGAVPGKGPVIRLGDSATVFDPAGLAVLTQVARTALGNKFQKRIMDNGSCEGTVAVAHGIPTIALSLPLGNYHNISYQGGPDSRGRLGPGPEFVHIEDIRGLMRICQEIIKPGLPWTKPWQDRIEIYQMMLRNSSENL